MFQKNDRGAPIRDIRMNAYSQMPNKWGSLNNQGGWTDFQNLLKGGQNKRWVGSLETA